MGKLNRAESAVLWDGHNRHIFTQNSGDFKDRLCLMKMDGPGETNRSFVGPLGSRTLPHTSLWPGTTCTSSQRFKKDWSSD